MYHKPRGRGWTAVFLVASLLALYALWSMLNGSTDPGGEQSLPTGDESGAVSVFAPGDDHTSASQGEEEPQPEPADPAKSEPKEEKNEPQQPGTNEPADEPRQPQDEPPAQEPEQPAAQPWQHYDFTLPAPESEAVEKDYFKDAAFVGDSRTDGFMLYSGIGGGKNLTSNGLSIFKLREKKALTIGGEKYTLLEALALQEYGKVYLCLGVNELGYDDDEGFYRSYCDAIDAIRAVQPNAVIYIQGLIPINEGVIAQTIKRDYLTNEHLRIYDSLMRKAAQEKQVVFLDLYSAFVDENNELPADAAHDGVHLSRAYCVKWLDYLRTHTVDPYAAPAEEPAEPELPAEPEAPAEPAQTEDGSTSA